MAVISDGSKYVGLRVSSWRARRPRLDSFLLFLLSAHSVTAAAPTKNSSNSIASELLPTTVQDPLVYDESKQDATAVMSQVPAWVAYDRKVLRFYAYFTETVPESPLETERVRRMTIYFYLEDDSIHIAEQSSVNSGMPQVHKV